MIAQSFDNGTSGSNNARRFDDTTSDYDDNSVFMVYSIYCDDYDNIDISQWIETIKSIRDIWESINAKYYCFKNELKHKVKTQNSYAKVWRMDRLIGKREERIGLRR